MQSLICPACASEAMWWRRNLFMTHILLWWHAPLLIRLDIAMTSSRTRLHMSWQLLGEFTCVGGGEGGGRSVGARVNRLFGLVRVLSGFHGDMRSSMPVQSVLEGNFCWRIFSRSTPCVSEAFFDIWALSSPIQLHFNSSFTSLYNPSPLLVLVLFLCSPILI